MTKVTEDLNEILPIEVYEKLHFPKLSRGIECHIKNYIMDDIEAEQDLKRLIFVSLREYINDFDDREGVVPNLGINDDSMCASRYRKISRQVCRMGGWANFESYINGSFVNEAYEFNKLAMFVNRIANIKNLSKVFPPYQEQAKKLIKGLK